MSLIKLTETLKHMAGKHPQKTHGHGSEGGGSSDADTKFGLMTSKLKAKIDYPYLPDDDKVDATIDGLIKAVNPKTGASTSKHAFDISDSVGVSIGFTKHVQGLVKDQVQEYKQTSGYASNPAAAREDRLLNVRDSGGKAQARK